MKNVFSRSEWIWNEKDALADSYADFYVELNVKKVEKTKIRLSCDSDYVLIVNGKYAASNQYADFEYYKIYDETDITEYLREGKNSVCFVIWYFGVDSQKYCRASAGLIFEILDESDNVIIASGENVLSRRDPAYAAGRQKAISYQLGFSFFYDATKDDSWQSGKLVGFHKSVVVNKNCRFFPRPNEKLKLGDRKALTELRKWHSNLSVFADLGEECVGLAEIEFDSPCEQKITVTWCEELSAGNVRRYMSANDYSFEIMAKKGKNRYFNPFLRVGCRYMQVDSEKEIRVDYLGIRPFLYPLERKADGLNLDEEDRKIYELCVKTLRLCAFEHYVDCPFREQGLYTYDSRNQMLSGYFAFKGYDYAYSNLKLLSMDRREDKLMSVTVPCKVALAIPAYSLYYIIQVWEYLLYSNTKTLDSTIIDKISDVISVFYERKKDGLICNFKGADYWNFYDWSDNLNGYGANRDHDGEPDLNINCLYIMAMDCYSKICERVGITPVVTDDLDEMRRVVFAAFYDKEDGLLSLYAGQKIYTQLSNSLAVVSGCAADKSAAVCKKMAEGKTSECSLSMKPFYYDALLKTSKEYSQAVLSEIRKNYGYMLSRGATSVWETMESPTDGGSFCHGWSAIPVYYYHLLRMGTNGKKG